MRIGKAPVFIRNLYSGVSFFILFQLLSSCASHEKLDINAELAKKRVLRERKIVVARVGDVEISKDRVDVYAGFMAPKVVPHSNVREKRMNRFRAEALDKIIVKELKYREGQERGVSVDPKLIEADIKKMEKGLPSGVKLNKILADQGRDREWLRNFLVKNRVVNTLMKEVNSKIADDARKKTGPEAVNAYYAANIERFRGPEQIRVREILIKAPPGSSEEQWTKAREKAAWILERARAGDSFASLAREFSDDSYSEKGGDMGLVGVNNLMGDLQSAVSGLKAGELVGPVYSMYGYHVLKVLERKRGVLSSLESVRKRIYEYLLDAEKKRMMAEWLDGLKKKTGVEYLYDFKTAGSGG